MHAPSSLAAMLVMASIALGSAYGHVARRDGSLRTSGVHAGGVRREVKRSLPFTHMIAFGDDYSDNGLGSFAHGITGDPKTLWGFGTWTDGHVSVTALARRLGIPLTYDYAFGSSGGGEVIGSVCDSTLIDSSQSKSYAMLDGSYVPSALDQVKNYTSGPYVKDASNALHVLWTANNDVIASLGWAGRFTICDKDTLCHPGQQKFVDGVVKSIVFALKSLVSSGAKYILVPNVAPRQLSPWTSMWISSEAGLISDFGSAIHKLNSAIESNITALNKELDCNIIYFDVNSWMTQAISNPSSKTFPLRDVGSRLTYYVSVDQDAWNVHWAATVLDKKPSNYFWMTEIMPSSTVLRQLAHAMYTSVAEKY
ncbi:hypothetical protein P7C70_g2272, partial [Phenoliferia sp. Uapishka_3]